MKRYLFLLPLIAWSLTACLEKEKIRVACIGDSITYGENIPDREHDSYPASLQTILGEKYDVRNFGISARTVLRKGDFPYFNEPFFREARDFQPEIVIIKLGTNDSKPQNWQYKDDFRQDLSDLVDSFRMVTPSPEIYLCRPVPVYEDRWGIREGVITEEIVPIIEAVAAEKNIEVIDLHTPLSNHEALFPDKVHPNAEGARLMAETIAETIRQ